MTFIHHILILKWTQHLVKVGILQIYILTQHLMKIYSNRYG